jgi:hypothetical protein
MEARKELFFDYISVLSYPEIFEGQALFEPGDFFNEVLIGLETLGNADGQPYLGEILAMADEVKDGFGKPMAGLWQ